MTKKPTLEQLMKRPGLFIYTEDPADILCVFPDGQMYYLSPYSDSEFEWESSIYRTGEWLNDSDLHFLGWL